MYSVLDKCALDTAVLTLKARSIFKFSAVYDVVDSVNKEHLASFRRQGRSSIFNTEWQIASPSGEQVGYIREESVQNAIDKRFFGPSWPLRYSAVVDGLAVCSYEQDGSLFRFNLTARFLQTDGLHFDRRLGLAAAILLCLVEGKPRPWGMV